MKTPLWRFYVYKFFDDFILIYSFYAVMFADFSVSPAHIGILLGVWSFVAFTFEVPSGMLADTYSRKYILFVSQCIRAIGYSVWMMFPSFTGFLIGFICWGVNSALDSGTFEAYLYDFLDDHKQSDRYTEVLGRAKGFSHAGNLVAAGLAAIMIQYGYTTVLIYSIIAVILTALTVLTFPKAKMHKTTGEKQYFKILKDSLHNIKSRPILIYLIGFIVLTYGLGGALDEYWSLFAKGAGTSPAGIAIFLGLAMTIQMIASFYVYKFEKLSSRSLYGILMTMGVLLIVAAYLFSIFSLMLLIIYSGLFTLVVTLYEGKLQDHIPTKTRATISSVSGFFIEIFAMLVYLTFGLIAGLLGYQDAFVVFGYVTLIIGFIYLLRSLMVGNVVTHS